MRIELTSLYSRTVTAALKAGTGTSSVTSPLRKKRLEMQKRRWEIGTLMLVRSDYTLDCRCWQLQINILRTTIGT